jgi:hypothetical protein
MELIPILSTIILIATISTFLLAIGAYVLYKTRERRGQVSVAPRQADLRAEIVSPAGPSAQQQAEQPRQVQQPIYSERQPVILQQQAPAQQQRLAQRPQAFTTYGQQPGNPNVQQPGQYNKTGYVQQRGFQAPQQGDEKTKKDSKFLKYTAEGYVVPAKENKDSGAARWR